MPRICGIVASTCSVLLAASIGASAPIRAQTQDKKTPNKAAKNDAARRDKPALLPDLSTAKLYPAGVDQKIALAIRRGLEYLSRTQNRDGSWRSNGGMGGYPTAMTALAGTALAASGSTTTRGPYAVRLRRATDFLLGNARSDGLIAKIDEEAVPMYGHGFSMLFLAQIYGVEEEHSRQRQVHRTLKKGVELTARSQSGDGGWLYTPDANSDEGSVTITQVQALRASRNAGIAVPTKVIRAAIDYIAKCKNPDGGISYSLRNRGRSLPAITAAAVAVLYNAGKYDDPMAEKAMKYAQRNLPISGGKGHHMYAHYYLAQALYQRGGKDWDDYYKKMSTWLLRQQAANGSWKGGWVGTTYGTAIALTILQLPHAKLAIYQR